MMNLRRATHEDAQFLLDMRNDPTTLEQCVSTGVVSQQEHAQWLARKLDRERLDAFISGLYIAEVDGKAVGRGSIDPGNERAVLSYTIDSAERGNGKGTELVRLLVAEAHRMGYRDVVCVIKRPNTGSVIAAMLGGVDSIAFI
jgi:RimJ/RimL family protein N-acetyltransferase